MTTLITTTIANSQMHNDIMAADSIDCQPGTDDTPAVPKRTVPETFLNISPENKAHYDVKAEAIHLILTGIGDDIYSTVDACTIAKDMGIAIERLQQGESLNKQDVKTNLFLEFGEFTSRDGESIVSYYSRFYTMMNEMVINQLEVATMQENYQNEVNEIRAEKIAKNANPLALVAAAQHYPNTYYQALKSHKSHAPPSKQSSYTRSHATTRNKGKEIAKLITPPSESASEEDEDSDPEQAQRDKEMQKNLALIAKYFKKIYKPTNNNLRTASNTRNKNVDTSPRYKNDNQTGYFMAKIQEVITTESGSDVEPLEKVQSDTEYNVFANERQHSKQPESINDTYVGEKVDSNIIPDSSGMYDNDNQADQNAKEYDDERVVLANLIANLKLDNDENKKIQKQLKKANTPLAHEL
ncbi:hypothetical protein Tco_0836278 [Tanacetum coccineum]